MPTTPEANANAIACAAKAMETIDWALEGGPGMGTHRLHVENRLACMFALVAMRAREDALREARNAITTLV